ncbi:hypothetical protein A4D02_32775 [Niastella koreensis]|uniref:Uncharacterized protein n=2 Tax=Niastella koreensis TaxID=354356 RepID=G8T7G3_NIAKG|nr:hypothetical protein [Niastella koreensis]AEW01199.1 hypothetical protein Niako_4959 [Niastella koreensis GR20-10]OQP45967.1 hypothetical protein A4D02_32775 [Niastella koreensis]
MNLPGLSALPSNKEQIAIDNQLQSFLKVLAGYEPTALYNHCFELLRGLSEQWVFADELDVNFFEYTSMALDTTNEQSKTTLQNIRQQVQEKYSPAVSERFYTLVAMCASFQETMGDAMNYFAARRSFLNTTLLLIPHVCKGEQPSSFVEILNILMPPIEKYLVGLSAAYFDLLKNEALELPADGDKYKQLESVFIDPFMMYLHDNAALGEPDYPDLTYQQKPAGLTHAFVSVENTLMQFNGAYGKYGVADSDLYQQLEMLVRECKKYCTDGYTIIIPHSLFSRITADLNLLNKYLTVADYNYSTIINTCAPFVAINGNIQTSVTLLTGFVNQIQAKILTHNKSYQADTGACFVRKVTEALAENGFTVTTSEPAEVVATKNNSNYRFHLKNNLIDLVRVENDYKKMGRLNRLRIREYGKQIAEKQFVICRFPVLTSNAGIINFSSLWESLQEI